NATADAVTIHGDAGSVSMSFFRAAPIMVTRDGVTTTVTAADPPHVHQPFVEQVVAHIRGDAPNPCSGQEALHTAVVMESIVRPATRRLAGEQHERGARAGTRCGAMVQHAGAADACRSARQGGRVACLPDALPWLCLPWIAAGKADRGDLPAGGGRGHR